MTQHVDLGGPRRQCPFPGCSLMIPTHLFGCRRHWFSLSKEAQKTIYEAYYQWKAGRLEGDELRRIQAQVIAEASA